MATTVSENPLLVAFKKIIGARVADLKTPQEEASSFTKKKRMKI